MQLRIRQRIFSWTDSYDVYDETGYAKYEVRGALFSLGHQIHVYRKNADEVNAEVGYIRQKLFSLMPTFELVKDGYVCGTIRKKFTFFQRRLRGGLSGLAGGGRLPGLGLPGPGEGENRGNHLQAAFQFQRYLCTQLL